MHKQPEKKVDGSWAQNYLYIFLVGNAAFVHIAYFSWMWKLLFMHLLYPLFLRYIGLWPLRARLNKSTRRKITNIEVRPFSRKALIGLFVSYAFKKLKKSLKLHYVVIRDSLKNQSGKRLLYCLAHTRVVWLLFLYYCKSQSDTKKCLCFGTLLCLIGFVSWIERLCKKMTFLNHACHWAIVNVERIWTRRKGRK